MSTRILLFSMSVQTWALGEGEALPQVPPEVEYSHGRVSME